MKNQTDLEKFEEFIVMMTGGEYRYTLPGRGITKKTVYRPFGEVAAEALVKLINQMVLAANRMAEELPAALDIWIKQVDALVKAHPELGLEKSFR